MFNINKIKKSLIILVAGVLLTSNFFVNFSVNAATLADVDSISNYAKDAIIELAENDLIVGDEDGNFNPQNTTTRAEMITMIVRALEIDTTNVPETPTFKDVPTTHWAYPYIEAAYREGIVKGISLDTFGKDDLCTREQMTAMFVRSLGLKDYIINTSNLNYTDVLTDKDNISTWAKASVEFSLASGLMAGVSADSFDPKGNAKREQAAAVVHRLINNDAILELADVISTNVQHPELLDAIMSQNTSSEYTLTSEMTLSTSNPEETMTINYNGTGKINGTDTHASLLLSMSQGELTIPGVEIELIQVDNKLFMKDPEFGEWYEATPDEAEGLITPDFMSMANAQFASMYNSIPIENMGVEVIDGVNLTRYDLVFDNEMLQELTSFLEDTIDPELYENNAEIDFAMSYFLNDQNQVVKEAVDYTTTFSEDGQDFIINMAVDTNYTNIGGDITIEAPAYYISLEDYLNGNY